MNFLLNENENKNENISGSSGLSIQPIPLSSPISYTKDRNIGAKSPSSFSMFFNKFNNQIKGVSFREDELTGRDSAKKNKLRLVRMSAQYAYHNVDLEPYPESIQNTKKAIAEFFMIAHAILIDEKRTFPLANLNKCMGFATINGINKVFIAVSQDKEALRDINLRKELLGLILKINSKSAKKFELVTTPTAEEFIILRTLNSTPYSRPAVSQEIQPRMRCVEVQLMSALNKFRKLKSFNPKDRAMLAVGGTLWETKKFPEQIDFDDDFDKIATIEDVDKTYSIKPNPNYKKAEHNGETKFLVSVSDKTNSNEKIAGQSNVAKKKETEEGVDGFGRTERNIKYLNSESEEIILSDGTKAYYDIWAPCNEHCRPNMKSMLAFSVADEHFYGRRNEDDFSPQSFKR